MEIVELNLKDFKAIKDTTIPLSGFTVLVGTNGSGKSSVLQAIHWMFQSGRNSKVSPTASGGGGSTLSVLDATYMPSPDYKNSSNSEPYGNFATANKMEVNIKARFHDGENDFEEAKLWIKSARNEGISVHVPSNNKITTTIRDSKREISAYIPGLAGIPLSEEKLSKQVVHRQAAAGDANTVLRNILDLLSKQSEDKINKLENLYLKC